jgi:YD repeat-containing protein
MHRYWFIIAVAAALVASLAGAQINAYSYDAAGHLLSVRYDATHSASFRYDTAGNITNWTLTGAFTEPDTDSDGMPDAWERVWFDVLTNAAAGDYNQDTVNNLQHYQYGTDPTDPDSDRDGAPNAEELVAGTNPTNALSLFRVSSFQLRVSNTVVSWSSTTGRFYSVDLSTNPLNPAWSLFTSDVPGAIGTLSITNSPGPGAQFYRIKVRKP